MVIPSIASANQLYIYKELHQFSPHQPVHIDIEDGNFVPNITFGIKTVNEISQTWDGPLDIHLLVTNPISYINTLAECNVKSIAFHIEAVEYPFEVIEKVKNLGLKVGIAFNFKTNLCSLEMFADDIDYVIIMTSEPDSSNLLFRPLACKRIEAVRKILHHKKQVWADGGITKEYLHDVLKAGADTVIMGRTVFNTENPKEELELMNTFFNHDREI